MPQILIRTPRSTSSGGTVAPVGPQRTQPQNKYTPGVRQLIIQADPQFSEFQQTRCEVGSVVPVVYGVVRVHPNVTSVDELKDYGINVEKNTYQGAKTAIGIEGKIELTFCVGKCEILSVFTDRSPIGYAWAPLVAYNTGLLNYVNLGSIPADNAMREGLYLPGILRINASTSHSQGGPRQTTDFHLLFFGYTSMEFIDTGEGIPDIDCTLRRDLSHTGIDYYEIMHVAGDGYDATPPSYDIFGSNPAAVIYDLLTDAQYGLGISADQIDKSSFNVVAKDMFDLKYGINFVLNSSQPASVTIEKICDMVGCALFTDKDSILTLRSILPINGENPVCTIEDVDMKNLSVTFSTYRDTSNVLTASFKSTTSNLPAETLTVTNDSNVVITGGRRNQSFDLSFFSHRFVATKRLYDLFNTVSYPLSSIFVTVSEEFYWLEPGDVVRVNSVKSSIDQPFRVIEITEPDFNSNDIRLRLVEVPYFTQVTTAVLAGESEGEIDPIAPNDTVENLTFPAFTNTSTAFSASFADPTKVHVRWGSGQEGSGELTYTTEFTVDVDKIVLDETIFANTIQANALGLLNIDVWETA